jgi:hypothetical protein
MSVQRRDNEEIVAQSQDDTRRSRDAEGLKKETQYYRINGGSGRQAKTMIYNLEQTIGKIIPSWRHATSRGQCMLKREFPDDNKLKIECPAQC